MPPMYYYNYAQNFGPRKIPRERHQEVVMQGPGPERASHYGSYYVDHAEIDEMGNVIREEMAVLRSGQDEMNSLLKSIVQSDTKRNEEIKALKRENSIMKADVGTLRENQQECEGKVEQLENQMRRMDQVIRETIRTEILKSGRDSKKNSAARGGRRGRSRQAKTTKGKPLKFVSDESVQIFNSNLVMCCMLAERKNCAFCGKDLSASYVRLHQKSSCPRFIELNQQRRQGGILLDQVEVPSR